MGNRALNILTPLLLENLSEVGGLGLRARVSAFWKAVVVRCLVYRNRLHLAEVVGWRDGFQLGEKPAVLLRRWS